ncbi:MAG: hypothetical protein R2778_12720 [Saprospiraceae bacterium]
MLKEGKLNEKLKLCSKPDIQVHIMAFANLFQRDPDLRIITRHDEAYNYVHQWVEADPKKQYPERVKRSFAGSSGNKQ